MDKEFLLPLGALLAIALVLEIVGPTSLFLLFAPNPITAVPTAIVLGCIDSSSCRDAVTNSFAGYTVTPESQTVSSYFCSSPSIRIQVHNPLALSTIRVLVNGQAIGQLAGNEQKTFAVSLNTLRPVYGYLKTPAVEERKISVEGQYQSGADILDKGKVMTKIVSATLTWIPSQGQIQAFEAIEKLNQTIFSCLARAAQAGQPGTLIIGPAQDAFQQAYAGYSSCDFSSTMTYAVSAESVLEKQCEEAYPKDIVEAGLEVLHQNAELIFYGILVLLGIFVLKVLFGGQDRYTY